ncbi:restriction endonuclease subunit S [Pseudomonas luteola]
MIPDLVFLSELAKIKTGKLDANASSPDGIYPFFTCAKEPLRIATHSYDCECVLVAGNGDLNVKYYSGKFDAYQRTYIIEPIDPEQLNAKYLYHFMDSYLVHLRGQSIGGIIKYIKLGNLTEAQIPLPPLPEQRRIAAILDKADALRAKRRQAIAKLDQLLQSVFLEMFGDPVTNPKGWEKLPLEELCEKPDDIKCGPFGTQLAKSEFTTTGIPLWGIKNVNAMFKRLTEEFVSASTAERLAAYSIQPGDIVMTRKGTIGNCAIYPQGLPLGIMHSDLLRLRVSEECCVPAFVCHQLHESQDVEHQLSLISGGAIMPGINVGKLKKLRVFVPPLAEQRQFATVLEKIEHQKRTLLRHAAGLDTLFYSLQQRAFAGEL